MGVQQKRLAQEITYAEFSRCVDFRLDIERFLLLNEKSTSIPPGEQEMIRGAQAEQSVLVDAIAHKSHFICSFLTQNEAGLRAALEEPEDELGGEAPASRLAAIVEKHGDILVYAQKGAGTLQPEVSLIRQAVGESIAQPAPPAHPNVWWKCLLHILRVIIALFTGGLDEAIKGAKRNC